MLKPIHEKTFGTIGGAISCLLKAEKRLDFVDYFEGQRTEAYKIKTPNGLWRVVGGIPAYSRLSTIEQIKEGEPL